MKYFPLFLLLAACSTPYPDQCAYPRAEIGIGFNANIAGEDVVYDNPVGTFRGSIPLSNSVRIEYEHHSGIFRGPPFAGKDKNVSDMINLMYQF